VVHIVKEKKPYDFQATLAEHGLHLPPVSIETLWVNITHLCNQVCAHCHVDASPASTEQMDLFTIDRCLEILEQNESCKNLDLTGGSPELNPHFDYFVVEAKKRKKHVIVRHNLTVTFDGNPQTGESKVYLPKFFAEHKVEVLASLPHYTRHFTDGVRGSGVFDKSVEGIRKLNTVGYGKEDTGLVLNLVYNANGPVTLEDRAKLEAQFRQELSKYDLTFNKLYVVTNMPIKRFRSQLQQSGTLNEYMDALLAKFSADGASEVVCRYLISVGYDGKIYDCDFNQMLGLQIADPEPLTVFNCDFEALTRRQILFRSHCFGCTAGGASS
jgi:radical SAM/Cys-rich protein